MKDVVLYCSIILKWNKSVQVREFELKWDAFCYHDVIVFWINIEAVTEHAIRGSEPASRWRRHHAGESLRFLASDWLRNGSWARGSVPGGSVTVSLPLPI